MADSTQLQTEARPADVATGRMTSYRWVVCALLFLALTVLYIDRQILGLLKPMLDDQFSTLPPAFGIESLKWSNKTFGLINSVFLLAYGFSLLGFGFLVDKIGTKLGYIVCVVAWSFSAASVSLVRTINGFFFARLAVGGSEGGCFPSSVKAVAMWFPKRERALATSIFNSGTNVGALLAPAIIPPMATAWGWQSTYIAAGLAGLLWVALWALFYNTPDKVKAVSQEELAHINLDGPEPPMAGAKMSWGSLLKYRQTWSFILAKFMTDPVWWFFLIWLPDYFKNSKFHLDIKKSWPHLMTIYLIVTVFSIMGGWVTGYLAKRGWTVTRARKTGMLCFAFVVMPIMAATSVSPWLAVIIIGLAGAAHQAWSANLFTTVSDMFPKRAVASITGMGGLSGCIGSAIFPAVTGVVLDHFKATGDVTHGYALLFIFCGLAYLVTFGLHHLLAPRFEQVKL